MINFRQIFADSNLHAVFRADSPDLWSEVYARLSFRPINYLESALDYQLAYQRGQGGEWLDLSCILRWEGKPVAIWPISIAEHDGVRSLSAHGMPVMPPLFTRECPETIRKKYIAECLRVTEQVSRQLGLSKWYSVSEPVDRTSITDWQLLSMQRGAVCSVHHDLYVDLRLALSDIKSTIRRSYRSLITSGERLWNLEILRSPGDFSVWSEFRQLHAKVAGRVTRSAESWQMQHDALASDEGFLVTLRSEDARMIGAGYFMCSADEGLYAVAAYDRNLFDRPIGHVVQYQAIQELQRRGCQWYRIGTRRYPSDVPSPTDKELSISYFKEGFATHVFPCFRLTHFVT